VAVVHDGQSGSSLDVSNYGSLTGSVNLNGGSVMNNGNGTWDMSGASEAKVVNAAQLVVSGNSELNHTKIIGDFTQTNTGTVELAVNLRDQKTDQITVTGDVQLDGRVKLKLSCISPCSLPVIIAEGKMSGTLNADSLALFYFEFTQSGQQLMLTTHANFFPENLSLDPDQVKMAEKLQAIWDQGSNPESDILFWELNSIASTDVTAYALKLSQLSAG
jgi:hypothetical protein